MVRWNNTQGYIISVNSLWTTLNQIAHFNGIGYSICIGGDEWVALWPGNNGSSHINKVTPHRAWLVLRCLTIHRHTASVCNQNHLGRVNFVPPEGREISTGQGTVAVLCAGNVTVGLALHQPSVTGSVIYPPYRLNGLRKRDQHPAYIPVRCTTLYFYGRPEGQTIIHSEPEKNVAVYFWL